MQNNVYYLALFVFQRKTGSNLFLYCSVQITLAHVVAYTSVVPSFIKFIQSRFCPSLWLCNLASLILALLSSPSNLSLPFYWFHTILFRAQKVYVFSSFIFSIRYKYIIRLALQISNIFMYLLGSVIYVKLLSRLVYEIISNIARNLHF